ncbi:hypothetical protein [Rubrimonas cliftonensis]|uniref:Uncharacterized protein n=1 Tax=Rubrimonas cliftonensis TaxID=89524 RepID=A0A1H4DC73_9RHOB|nr:hypothetical protein [Rubrimonas cliftonensis]SEA69872.1 hypothetical protein SAMN05444370_109135 [Rubrimonas cliftonensis]
MSVTNLPRPRRLPIEEPEEIAAIEGGLTAVHGLMSASGGFLALAGVEISEMNVLARAETLTRMYDAGEVVVGWRDGRDGRIVNVVIEKLAIEPAGGGFRAEVYLETEGGHALAGALAGRTAEDLADALLEAAADGLAAGLPSPGAALLKLSEG